MSERGMTIAIGAQDEFSSVLERLDKAGAALGDAGLAGLSGAREGVDGLAAAFGGLAGSMERAAGAERIGEGFASLGDSARGAKESVEELNGSLAASLADVGGGADGEGRPGFLWFLEGDKKDYDAALESYRDFVEAKIGLAAKEFTAIEGYQLLHDESLTARTQLLTSAYGAMETQMLRLVETHKFSARAFADAMAQQVKVELTGLSARAAVWALFETGMGFATVFRNPAESAAHFTAAAKFAAISAATVAAAAGVHELTRGLADGSSASGSSSSAKGAGPASGTEVPAGAPEARDTRPVQNVTVHVHNPLSDQNWDAVSEEIVEALNRAGDRNVAVSIRNMG